VLHLLTPARQTDVTLETIADRLQRIMRDKGLKPGELAKRAGLDRANPIHDILSGHSKRPAADVVLRISRALEVTPDVLVFGEEREVSSVAEAREHISELFLDLMRVLNALERQHPSVPHLVGRATERQRYSTDPRVPVIPAKQGRLLLNHLARKGRLGEVAAGTPKLAILLELPQDVRTDPEIDEIYRTAEHTEFSE